ncbi:hypothetical protein TRVL_09380 [Trypanosoma vivax]|nr:hypothetical protein TRVL_09380 [Trypanosoma vivax]
MYRQAGRARFNGSRLASWPLRHAGRPTQAFASAEGGFDAIVSLCGEFWFCTRRRLFPLKLPLQDARCASKALFVGRERCVLKPGSANPFWGPGAPLNAMRRLCADRRKRRSDRSAVLSSNAPPSAPKARDWRPRRYLQLAASRRLCRTRRP